ncbi:MAG TPA: hypothetical protein EYN67_03405, partial [Flavobacteriales bacterium]|nr:hypothetical protein [Flavobacteriales bacterium]
MNKTIKDAYEALKGDLNNTIYHYSKDRHVYYRAGMSPCEYTTFENYANENQYQYICTVQEFNNYKPVKTTMDAVNDNKGVWPACYIASITCDNGKQLTCHREEFNQLVSECETNFGASVSYAEYKKLYNSVMGESPLETPLDDNSKPVYTKEMADNGVIPSVGMECLIMYSSS